MPLSKIRQELISKVKPGEGQNDYRTLMELIPDDLRGVSGHLGNAFHIRAIKGTQRLSLDRALLTHDGMATEDGQIVDCGAALVTLEPGNDGAVHYDAKRLSGKENGAVQRIRTSYDPHTLQFGLGTDAIPEKMFPVELLQPSSGYPIQVKMGGDILLGVLSDNELLLNHLRACLAEHVKNPSAIRLLLRTPTFARLSDTAQAHQRDIRTLFTDGSQLHLWNKESGIYENARIPYEVHEDANRPNMSIDGIEIHPFAEDVIDRIVIATKHGRDPIVELADLTPRCAVPQKDPLTGETLGKQPMLWRYENRPHVPVGPKQVLTPTAGANGHVDPLSVGPEGILIEGGAPFQILGEKQELRR